MYDDIELEKVRGLLDSLLIECEAVQKELAIALKGNARSHTKAAYFRLCGAIEAIKEQKQSA